MKSLLPILATSAIVAVASPAYAATQIQANARQQQYIAEGTFVGNANASGAVTFGQLISASGLTGGDFPTVNFGLSDLTSFYFNSTTDYLLRFVRGNDSYTQTATAAEISFNSLSPGSTTPIRTTISFQPGTFRVSASDIATPAVPEPATWAMMLVGFGLIGATVRYRRRSTTAAYA